MQKEIDPNGLNAHESGAKLDDGKILAGTLMDFSLALLEIAKVGTYGATKYSRGGWQSVPCGIQRYADAKWRHMLAQRWELIDESSGLLHLAQEAWNCLAELELTIRGMEGKQ